jgi:hypothetical protein
MASVKVERLGYEATANLRGLVGAMDAFVERIQKLITIDLRQA